MTPRLCRLLASLTIAAAGCARSGDLAYPPGDADTDGLSLSNVAAAAASPTIAVVSWSTNQVSTSIVQYGQSASYGATTPLYGLTLDHAVQLTDLTPATLYHYAVTSSDAGTLVSSDDLTFITPCGADRDCPTNETCNANGQCGGFEAPYGGTAWPIPGIVEAEDYDLGGEGVAYHDEDDSNTLAMWNPSVDRGDAVDLKTCTDTTGCGAAVGSFDIGEWLSYTVAIATPGAYTLSARVATIAATSFHLEVDGTNVTGSIAVPANESSWDGGWDTVRTANFALAVGGGTLRIVNDAGYFDINDFELVCTAVPYDGALWAIPGTIEAENYDVGSEGAAYHDDDATNTLGADRNDGVDIKSCTDTTGCGYAVGTFDAGEWMQYTVDVTTSGTYLFSARAATISATSFHVEVDGIDVTGAIAVPANEDNWDESWETVSAPGLRFDAGARVVRVVNDAGFFDINDFTFTLVP